MKPPAFLKNAGGPKPVCCLLLLASFCVSCAGPQRRNPPVEPLERISRTGTSFPEKTAIPTEELVEEIVDLDANLEDNKKSDDETQSNVAAFPKVLVEVNANVRRWIQYFSQRDNERFNRFLQRGYPYKKLVQQILRERGVPEEFYYLAMIESGYTTSATSRASAVGFWQFVEGTGTRYGLRTNYYVDERRDPIRATHAAAEYLQDLHNIFGSWHLAMAAYNAGEIRILRAIMKAKSRDFWTLVEKKALPTETMEYVPKFLAALIIGKNPSAYGLEDPSDAEPMTALEPLEVPSAVKLTSLAAAADLPVMELARLNPHLLRGITPPSPASYPIWVPKGTAKVVAKSDVRFIRERAERLRPVPSENSLVAARTHRVKRGETLRAIARRYQVSEQSLRRLNGLTSSRIPSGKKLKVPVSAASRIAAVQHYRVRRGDTLTGIASKFGLSIHKLKSVNKLRRDQLFTGQVLKVASRDI